MANVSMANVSTANVYSGTTVGGAAAVDFEQKYLDLKASIEQAINRRGSEIRGLLQNLNDILAHHR